MSPLVRELLRAAAIMLGSLIAAMVVRRILSTLARRFDRTQADMVDHVFRALGLPAVLLILLGGIYLSLYQVVAWQPALASYKRWFVAAATLIVVMAISRFVSLALMWYARRTEEAGGPPGQLGLLRKLAILVIWILGILQVLSQMGQPIATVLASLGIASLAIGLALQDTIANLFAGFYIVADRSIRAGDYVRLESGDEGFVEQVGWRNTRIRLWANNIVLVPNNKLVQSIITNMTLPNPVLSVYTWCGVSYSSDLEEVERVTLEVANKVIRDHPGAELSYNPVVRFKEFGDSNITFVVIFRANEVGAQYLLQHEFVKALHKRFKEENIDISFPIRKLVWEEGVPFPVEQASARQISSKVP